MSPPLPTTEQIARVDGTFAGRANRQAVSAGVRGYRGMRGSRDAMRAYLLGAWARVVRRCQSRSLPPLVQLTASELAGYFWARHQRRAYAEFLRHPAYDRLRLVRPQTAVVLYVVCEAD